MVSTMTSVEPITIPEGYKQTEVGVIPMEWDTKLLRNISPSISVGLVINPSSYFDEKGKVPMLVGSTVKENKILWEKANCISEASNKKIPASRLRAGDLVTVRVGEPGITAVIPPILDDCNCASMMIVRKSAAFDSVWLCFVMNSKIGITQIKDVQYGTAQKQFNISDALNFNYPFPPLKEQTAIANALSDVDNLIASLETLIAKKSAIKTAAMQQLLTGKKRLPAFVKESETIDEKQSSEPDNTSETAQAAQTKQTSTLNSDLYKESGEALDLKSNQQSDVGNANNKQTASRPGYKQSELGEIPEDWEVESFSKIAKPKNNRVNPKVEGGGDLCIELEHIGQGTGSILGNTVTTNNSSLKNIFEVGDVLFGKLRSYLKKYWLADFIGVCSTEIWVLESNRKRITPEYLFQVVRLDRFIECTSESYGTHMPRSDWKVVKEYLVPLPSLEEQAAIANVLSNMDTELDALQQRLSKTQKIKQGMMQELLTGKTRLI
jgi:type I restriction enzyme S subunit